MRILVSMLLLCGLLMGDGGMGTCDDGEYVYDKVITTRWKARVLSVSRNGVPVTSGTYAFSNLANRTTHTLAGLDSVWIRAESPDTAWPWSRISLNGGGTYVNMIAVGP